MFAEWKVHSPAAATLNVIDGWEARAHQREERDEVARLRAASAALQEQSHSQNARRFPIQLARLGQAFEHENAAEGRRAELHPAQVERARQIVAHADAAEERAAELHPLRIDEAEQGLAIREAAEGRAADYHPLRMRRGEQQITLADLQERRAAEAHVPRLRAAETSADILQTNLQGAQRGERTAAAKESDTARLTAMRNRLAAGQAILSDAEDYRVARNSGDKGLLKAILSEVSAREAAGEKQAALREDADYQYPATLRAPEYPSAQPHEAVLYDQQWRQYKDDQARLREYLDERDAFDAGTTAAQFRGRDLGVLLAEERKLPAKLGKDERIPVWDKDGNLQLLGGGSAAGGIPGLENGIIRPTDGKGGLLPSALPVIKNAANYPPDEVMNAIAPGFSQDMLKDQAEAIEEGRTAPENVIELYRSVINEIYNPANASQTIDTLTANLIAEQKRLTPGGFGESVDRYMHEQYTKEAGNLAKRIGGSLSKTILGAMTSDQKQRLSGVFHGFVRRQKETLRKANAKFVEDNARRLTAQFPGAITYPEARGAIKRAYQISEYDSEWNKPALAPDPQFSEPITDPAVLESWTKSIGAFAGEDEKPDKVVAAHPIGKGMLILNVLADGKKKMHVSAPQAALTWTAEKWKQMMDSGVLVVGEGYFSNANAK